MGQLKEKVGTGVIAGEKLNELFAYAKEKQVGMWAMTFEYPGDYRKKNN